MLGAPTRLGLLRAHWWLLWMLEAPPTPLGSAVLIGWLLWRPLCLFTPELSVGPAAGVAAKVQSQHPRRNQRHMINNPVPLPSPPRAWRGRVLFTALLIPQQDSSPSAHRGHLLHNHTPFPAFPSLALHFTLLLVFPGIVSQGGHLSLNPSQGLLLGKRKLRQSPCLCKWFSCSWLRCMCVCVRCCVARKEKRQPPPSGSKAPFSKESP